MPDPITVMHLRASNFVGGPEKQILEHLQRLDRKRFRPLLCCFRENGQDDPLLEHGQRAGITCRSVISNSSFDLRTISQLRRILLEEKVDLICSHGYKPNIVGRFAAWSAGIPAIAISRGWTAESSRIRLYEKLDKFFLRLADYVVAVSHGQRDKILALGIAPDKVAVIHNAINLDAIPVGDGNSLRREMGLPEDALIVASAGRLSPEKNYAAMIEAASETAFHDSGIYFIIFGEGFLRSELEKKIRDAGLTERFLLPGFRKDLQSVLHEIDIFILTSFTEGLPNVVLEAFAACKPVVATRVGGTPEVVQDDVCGFLTGPDEVSVMARHILDLAKDEKLRLQMGKAGYEYVQEHFSFESQTYEYENIYSKIKGLRRH